MKKLIFLLLMIWTASLSAQKIKSANYWISPIMSIEQARALSANKYNLIIVDYENMVNNHSSLDTLKLLNPGTKLLAYANPVEIFEQPLPNRPLQNSLIERVNKRYPAWLLRNSSGESVVFYKGMKMMNMSSVCPKINKRNYGEWFADTLISKVLSDPIWDGFFMDNASRSVSWIAPNIDADNDWLADSSCVLDQHWGDGIHNFLKKIRIAKGKDFILIGNRGSVDFTDLVDGRMFEFFPNDYLGGRKDGGWWQSMSNASQTGEYTIFLVKEKDLEFGLASALLLDNILIAIGQNNTKFYPQLQENAAEGGVIKIQRQRGSKITEVIPSKKSGVFIKK